MGNTKIQQGWQMKVLYIGCYRDGTGWGNAATDYILAMDSVGINVVPRPVKLNARNPEIPARLIELENRDSRGSDVCIQHVLPHMMDYNGIFEKNIAIPFHSLGLDKKYTRDVNGNITTNDLSDLEVSKFAYVNNLVTTIFNQPNFNFNTFGDIGPEVSNIIKGNDRLITKSSQSFINTNDSIMPIIEEEKDGKKQKIFDQSGYDRFVEINVKLLVRFANSKSLAYREYVMANYSNGAYRPYFEKYLEELASDD